jgi:hypothetical protein
MAERAIRSAWRCTRTLKDSGELVVNPVDASLKVTWINFVQATCNDMDEIKSFIIFEVKVSDYVVNMIHGYEIFKTIWK